MERRTGNRGARSALAAFALLSAATQVSGMVVRERNFAELVAAAEQIVVGTVGGIHVSRDARGAPLTLVHFVDIEVLKGSTPSPLTLEFYGGATDGTNVRLSGTPRFAEGDRAVVFIADNGRAISPLVGVWQGLFRLRFDRERGAEVVETHARVPVVGLTGRRLRLSGAVPEDEPPPLTLEEFGDAVARELGLQQRAGKAPSE